MSILMTMEFSHTLFQWIVVVILLSAVVLLTRQMVLDERMRRMMPPGPPGVPLLGNVLQLSGSQWLQFTAWSRKYGLSYLLTVPSYD